MKDDQLAFENRAAFKKWLAKNHVNSPGIWLVFGKHGKLKTLSANEALEEALCFGWIDGQLQSLGSEKYLKRFTPRRRDSVWSERNRKLAQKLSADGDMTAAGQAAITQAHNIGTWHSPKRKPVSEAQVKLLIHALSGTGKAQINFLNMSPSVRRIYTGFYFEAKKEDTRKKRLERIIERLNENKKPM